MIGINEWISIITHIYTILFFKMFMGGVVKQLTPYFVCDTVFEVWVKLLIQRSSSSFEQTSQKTSYFNLVVGLNFELAMSVNGEIT